MSDLSYQGQIIQQRDSDGYVNATQMAKANSVRFADWEENKQSKDYVKALEKSIFANNGINTKLVEVKGFGADKTQWIHPLLAIAFAQWISPEFHVWCNQHIKTLIETGKTQLIENLENQFVPNRSLKEIKEYLELSQSVYGETYKQRLFPIVMKKYHPDLPVISPATEEKASVSEGEALLTVTQLAEAIGLFYTTGRGDARRLNVILKDLGYQLKIAGQWSATEKAKGLCDRKPVDTNSRTQKDQLMWKATMVDILKEHCIFE